jgi:integrase
MTVSLEGRIAQANGRLKASNVGIRIELDGESIYLRGILPPKPDSKHTQPTQQRIPLKRLGLRANSVGIVEAEKEARLIGSKLARKEFDWEPYLYVRSLPANTFADHIDKFRSHKLAEGITVTTWIGDYWKILKRLPQDRPLEVSLLEQVVLATKPNTKMRQRACLAIGAFARFTNLDYDPALLAGKYSPKDRDLPDDRAIAEWYYKISNPAWQWVYGMIATYGLRPHEVFRLDLEELRSGSYILSVHENTKTGARRVWPCYPEWFEQFSLKDVQLPGIKLDRSNTAIGESCSKYFNGLGLPFVLYDMRHRWAIRTLESGIDISIAAKQMGHSVQTHSKTYHQWISDKEHQRAFDAMVRRSDRPKAPEI